MSSSAAFHSPLVKQPPFTPSSSSRPLLPHHRPLGSQPNSPTDSAIGTASDSLQSPPLETSTAHRTAPPPKMTPKTGQESRPSTSEARQPPRPPKNGQKGQNNAVLLGLPILKKVVCERDFERVVKETEVIVGGRGTSQEQLMAESRLSRECLLRQGREEPAEWGDDGKLDRVQESRRYYYFDPVRHEYRLYYSREVRLRSESNLVALGLEEGERRKDGTEWAGGDGEGMTPMPLRRRHSAGAGRLRRAVPPPKNGLMNGPQLGTTQFPANGTKGHEGGQIGAKQEQKDGDGEDSLVVGGQQQATLRRGTFERNSSSRKPFHTRAVSDPPRRRQWSGGAKRAALKQQQELEQQRRMAGGDTMEAETRPVPAARHGGAAANGMEMASGGKRGEMDDRSVVTNQMLKELLRPLQKNEKAKEEALKWANEPVLEEARWAGRNYDRERLLEGHPVTMAPKGGVPAMEGEGEREEEKKRKPSIWDCFRRKGKGGKKKGKEEKKRLKTVPESGRPPNRRLQRYIGYLLIPLFLLVAAAAIAIVVIIWYI